MNNTFKILSLALSVALPLGTALADTLDTDTVSGAYAEQARTRAGEFQAAREAGETGGYDVQAREQARARAGEFQAAREAGETRGYDVQAREQSRDQVRAQVSEQRMSREQAGESFAAGVAAREGWSSMQRPASVERPSSMQRPSAASRPSMPMQRPRMR